MNPIFNTLLLFELKNQIRGKRCAYFRQKELRFVFANKKYYQRAIEWIKNYLFNFSLLRISWSVSKVPSIPSYDFVLLGPCFLIPIFECTVRPIFRISIQLLFFSVPYFGDQTQYLRAKQQANLCKQISLVDRVLGALQWWSLYKHIYALQPMPMLNILLNILQVLL